MSCVYGWMWTNFSITNCFSFVFQFRFHSIVVDRGKKMRIVDARHCCYCVYGSFQSELFFIWFICILTMSRFKNIKKTSSNAPRRIVTVTSHVPSWGKRKNIEKKSTSLNKTAHVGEQELAIAYKSNERQKRDLKGSGEEMPAKGTKWIRWKSKWTWMILRET